MAALRANCTTEEIRRHVNVHALDVNSDAIATSVLTFGYDTATVNAVAGKPGKSKGLYRSGAATR